MEDLIEIKPTLSEKIAAYQKKLSDSYEISLLYTDFRKEIKIAKNKLNRNSSLQNYYNRNHLFELKKLLEKEEKVLKHWLEKLLKACPVWLEIF
jgi:ectoine hydroxylase-related dioxygenase (phytanoyl-CoA dioxygenase family)